jgi:osmotically-inducible protein OsmY
MKHLLFMVITGVIATSSLLTGCVPLVVGAAVGGTALVATDRRSVGAQADDESIELKIANSIGTGYGDRVHVNVTSYNGVVLLTGEVPTPDIVASIGDVARTTAKVRVVHNEIVVAAASPLGSRSNDSYITSKVKTRFVEKNKFSATHVKVVTDRQVVYLMGLVKRDEADNAAQIASTTEGVLRVVKLFEPIS